jgi:uroporphyrinogen III methyltransferase/synthase
MRVLVTRSQEQAETLANALFAIGAEPIYLPVIKIMPVKDSPELDGAIKELECYDWLVFTSTNAVKVVFDRMGELGIQRLSGNLRTAVIGPSTSTALEERGFSPDYMPGEYIAEAVVPGLGELRGRHVLLPTADIASDTLPGAIQVAGGIPHAVTVYHTIPAEPDPEGLEALRNGVDVITFTSGSTVRNFCRIVEGAGINPLSLPGKPRIACIGPKTRAEAERIGFSVDIQPEQYTTQGLVDAITQIKVRNNH